MLHFWQHGNDNSAKVFNSRLLHAGVASNGERAVIVGGWTNARPHPKGAKKYLWLADVWEYYFAEDCWIQVCS